MAVNFTGPACDAILPDVLPVIMDTAVTQEQDKDNPIEQQQDHNHNSHKPYRIDRCQTHI